MDNWEFLFKRGLQGEALVREWLKLRGFYVLPTSLIQNGGAPALESFLNRITASDILVAGHGRTYWAEIKTYSRSTWNQIRQREEHGVPIKNWNQYLEGERITGIPGYLYILQLNERKILEGSLKTIIIGSVEMFENYPPSGPQIFFDVFRFNWYNLDTLEIGQLNYPIPDPIPPKTIRPWERDHKFPKFRQIPMEYDNAKHN
jgi:hypothetical protein